MRCTSSPYMDEHESKVQVIGTFSYSVLRNRIYTLVEVSARALFESTGIVFDIVCCSAIHY